MEFNAWLVVILLALMNVGQWLLIWQLINRLLIQAHVPTLTPVPTTPPARKEPEPQQRRILTRLKIDDGSFSDE